MLSRLLMPIAVITTLAALPLTSVMASETALKPVSGKNQHERAEVVELVQSPVAEGQVAGEVKAALQNWLQTVASRNPEHIAALYSPDAVLLPTLSPNVADIPAERLAYFEHFTEKENLQGKIDEEHVRVLGLDMAVDSGLYTFTYTKNGQTYSVPARYTFVFKRMDGKWMIVEHHSSKTPE